VYLERIFPSLHIKTPGLTPGPFPEEAALGKVYLEEPTAVLLAKLFLVEGPRLPQRHQAPRGTPRPVVGICRLYEPNTWYSASRTSDLVERSTGNLGSP